MLSILLVDNQAERAAMVEQALQQAGHKVICQLTSTVSLGYHVARIQPDLIIIDMDSPDRDTLEQMTVVSQHNPKPMVFFANGDQSPDVYRQAIQAGVSAYIVDGLIASRVRPIVEVAIARFEEFQQLRQQLQQSLQQLLEQQLVDQAKRLLIKHQGCNETQAFNAMRKAAMDRQLTLADIARELLKKGEYK